MSTERTEGADRPRCPSSECRPGAQLLGVVLPNGRVAFTSKAIPIDEEFVRVAHEGRPPEQRFRFTTTCAERGCRQWADNRCGVIDRLLAIAKERGEDETTLAARPLPDCAIRSECRWYRQRGAAACAVCPDVVTDVTCSAEELPPSVLARREAHPRVSPPTCDSTSSVSPPGAPATTRGASAARS